MEQVFAPWRIEWVEREEGPDVDCVFCEFAERGVDSDRTDPESTEHGATDRENRVVARSERAYVLCNNYPYNPGHVMVIPIAHVDDPRELDDETLAERERLTNRTLDALEEAMGPDGFNVGMNLGGGAAGGSIADHVHTHVVPRWEGDTNFMPVVSDTKVIVEAVEATYDRLHAAFAEQDGASVPDDDGAVRIE